MENFETTQPRRSRFEEYYTEKYGLWNTMIEESNISPELKETLKKHLAESDDPHQFIRKYAFELDAIDKNWWEYDAAMKQERNLGIKNTVPLADNLKDPYTLYTELREDKDQYI